MACVNSCNSCPNIISASSITLSEGVYTITVPSTFTPTVCNIYCILLRTPIPTGSNCNSVVVTNGSATWNVLVNNGNNWRPCELKCRSILQLKYFDDPAHFYLCRVKR